MNTSDILISVIGLLITIVGWLFKTTLSDVKSELLHLRQAVSAALEHSASVRMNISNIDKIVSDLQDRDEANRKSEVALAIIKDQVEKIPKLRDDMDASFRKMRELEQRLEAQP